MVILSPGKLEGLTVNLILRQAIALINLAHVVHRYKEPLQQRVWEALECCKQKQQLIIVETGKIRNLKEIWAVRLCSAVVSEDCAEMNQQPSLLNPNDLAPFSLSSENPKEGEFKRYAFGLQRNHCSWLLLVRFIIRSLRKKHIKV